MEKQKKNRLQSCVPFQPNERFPLKPFLFRSSSVHMLIVWMCIETADLRIRLYSRRGLSPCQLIIAPRYRLHQKVTLVQQKGPAASLEENLIVEGEFRRSGRRMRAAARKISCIHRCRKRRMLLLCLLFCSYCKNIWTKWFISPHNNLPSGNDLRPVVAWHQILNQLSSPSHHISFFIIFVNILVNVPVIREYEEYRHKQLTRSTLWGW